LESINSDFPRDDAVIEHQRISGESINKDANDFEFEKLCLQGAKPRGNFGNPNSLVCKSQKLCLAIIMKSRDVGFIDDNDGHGHGDDADDMSWR
jgi:hypothetical protein